MVEIVVAALWAEESGAWDRGLLGSACYMVALSVNTGWERVLSEMNVR